MISAALTAVVGLLTSSVPTDDVAREAIELEFAAFMMDTTGEQIAVVSCSPPDSARSICTALLSPSNRVMIATADLQVSPIAFYVAQYVMVSPASAPPTASTPPATPPALESPHT